MDPNKVFLMRRINQIIPIPKFFNQFLDLSQNLNWDEFKEKIISYETEQRIKKLNKENYKMLNIIKDEYYKFRNDYLLFLDMDEDIEQIKLNFKVIAVDKRIAGKLTNTNMTISYKFCYWAKSNNRDSLKCMENLLKLGADPNAVAFSGFGRNPLHLAKNSDKINLLLDNGANINLQNVFGDTALLINTRKHLICYSRHNVENYLINVQTLLNRGANIYIKNRDGMNFGKLIADSRSLSGKKAITEVVNEHKINIEQLAKRAVDEASQIQTLEQQSSLRTVNESVRKLSAKQYARNRFEQESERVVVDFSEDAFLEPSSCSIANPLAIKNEIEDFQPDTMNFALSNFNNYRMDFEVGAGDDCQMDFEVGAGDDCQMDFEVEQGCALSELSNATLKTIKLKDISLQTCKKEPTRKFINKSVKEWGKQQQARPRETEQLKKKQHHSNNCKQIENGT
ncbi:MULTISPECIES: hypothetical protein [unclassified Spiroplasma]|uniref:ankyrin repeat domain-containing protein n=1 Tax=unclassified Spiroplasma TaxID=2637901 RepID=UPI00313DDBA8